MRFDEAVGAYALQLDADGRSIHTRMQYARHLRLFGAWLSANARGPMIAEITPSDIAAFFASDAARQTSKSVPKKATSTNALRSTLRTFFGYAHAAAWIASNPARLLRRARCGQPPPKALANEDREKLLATLAAANGDEARRDEMLIRLLLGAGLRIGSAVALDAADVDLERAELALRVAKNDAQETVFLSTDLVLRLRRYLEGRAAGPVFSTASGARLTSRQAGRRFRGWVARAGLARAASPHTCRHTFATTLLARTHDLALVQSALRHRSIASTLVYAKVEPERVRRAIEG